MNQADMLGDAPVPDDWLERFDAKGIADRWPRTLAEFVDVLTAEFLRRGLEPDQALDWAQAAVGALGQHLGGRPIYLPRGDRLATALRDRTIWCAFPRRSIEQLADQHGLTTRRIEQVLAEQRAIFVRRIQPGLFDPPTAP